MGSSPLSGEFGARKEKVFSRVELTRNMALKRTQFVVLAFSIWFSRQRGFNSGTLGICNLRVSEIYKGMVDDHKGRWLAYDLE